MSKDFENNDNNSKQDNFGLPEGYFQKSAGNILNRLEWLEEHKPYKLLSDLKNVNGFAVPENYFEASESKLELIDFPNLSQLKKDHGFSVPGNYFEELEVTELTKMLTKNVLNDILPQNPIDQWSLNELINAADKETDLAGYKTLSAVSKENPFAVGKNYFEQSAKKIQSALHPKTKVLGLFSAKALYSAAAAVLTITLGLWIYNQYFTIAQTEDCGTLACVEKNELMKAKALEQMDNEELYEIVDTKKLQENLEGKSEKATDQKNNDDSSLQDINIDDLPDEI